MRRRLLDAEHAHAEPDDPGALLRQMRSVLRFGGMWHARAEGREEYAEADTPEEAMRLALACDVVEEPAPAALPRRRGLIE